MIAFASGAMAMSSYLCDRCCRRLADERVVKERVASNRWRFIVHRGHPAIDVRCETGVADKDRIDDDVAFDVRDGGSHSRPESTHRRLVVGLANQATVGLLVRTRPRLLHSGQCPDTVVKCLSID